jgi:hypothetical protein
VAGRCRRPAESLQREQDGGVPARRHPRWAGSAALDPAGHAQQDIVDELRRVILDGVVPPGSPIPVNEVADRFGVSAIPVRKV